MGHKPWDKAFRRSMKRRTDAEIVAEINAVLDEFGSREVPDGEDQSPGEGVHRPAEDGGRPVDGAPVPDLG